MFETRSIKMTDNLDKRHYQPLKIYAAESLEIPLKKNWLDSWTTMPQSFETVLPDILSYEVRSDDVFVVIFPRAGTTWLQEAAWLLMNDLDFVKSKEIPFQERSPYLEHHGLIAQTYDRTESSHMLASPRLIKSHLPANLLPQQIWKNKTKTIYVARNCKDVLVSYYHFCKGLRIWLGDNFADFVEDFLNSELVYTNYWTHVVDFWKMRNESFIFFVTYEEMKRDLADVLVKLCTFLERPQLTAAEMELMLKHLSFESMKENRNTNLTSKIKEREGVSEDFKFMRRGIVGSYKDELTPELRSKIDAWSQVYLAQHDLSEEEIFGKMSS